ncbi:HEPN domain-containing protein [Sphingomonas sp. TDK1]|uniref:ApeA N-terminal domain 1-containing protein n=1 Tax=Sphingomonas sp. TDK1 TaxID=453247 RepID=UPI0018DBE449|nr:HEPN domain-containing protein [Sphingomonas sp. TDK1]
MGKKAEDIYRIAEGATIGGWYTINGRRVLGSLFISKGETKLFLQDEFPINIGDIDHINGELHNLEKITLVRCVAGSFGSTTTRGVIYYTAEIFPHFIVYGKMSFDPSLKNVTSSSFRVDDANRIFNDFDAFGTFFDNGDLIDSIASQYRQSYGREIPIGPAPRIAFFSGREVIVSVDTALGVFRALNSAGMPSFQTGTRASIVGRAYADVTFGEPISFGETINRVSRFCAFLGLIAGRPQNIEWVNIDIADGSEVVNLRVYWCLPPSRDGGSESKFSNSLDILIDAVMDSEEFSRVLTGWIDLEINRNLPRERALGCYGEQNLFRPDRLVTAANVFDLLSQDALPKEPQLEGCLIKAKEVAKTAFKALPPSDERDSILGALGRIGKPTLRQKISHRAQLVIDAMGVNLKEIDVVIDESVKCRNYFVHGSNCKIDYDKNWHLMAFLSRALEFIFLAAEMVDSGWKISEWYEKGSSLGHPFNQVLHEWDSCAQELILLRAKDPSSGG